MMGIVCLPAVQSALYPQTCYPDSLSRGSESLSQVTCWGRLYKHWLSYVAHLRRRRANWLEMASFSCFHRLAHSWSFKRYYGGNNFITLHGFFFCRSSTDLWGEEKSSSHSSSLPADLSLISSLLVKAASSQNSLVLMVQIRKSALLGFLWVVLPYVNS